MSDESIPPALAGFSALTPDRVLTLVEDALGQRCTNLCRPLTSYINRVYDLQLEDGGWVVAKFYRPGRWDAVALQDEQDFLLDLAAAELPVIAPRPGRDGATLHARDGLYFSIFPKKGGRPVDEMSEPQWKEFGRLMARVHLVGEQRRPRRRIVIHPQKSTRAHLRDILAGDFPYASLKREFEQAAEELLEQITPLFGGAETHRLHGDCHVANLIYRPG